MPTNNFVPVAAAAGSNVTSDAAWNGSSFQATGVQKGIVPSAGMNKAWRQGTMAASALGQMIVDHGLIDAVDDGNVAGLKANLRMAIAAMLAGVAFAVDGSSTPNLLTVILDPAPPTLSTYRGIFIRVANTNTGPVTLTLNNLGTKPVVRKGGLPLAAGDILQGQFVHLLYDLAAGQWVFAGSALSDIVAIIKSKVPGRTPWRQKVAGTYSLLLPAGTAFSADYLYGAGGGGGGGGGTAGGGGGGGARTTKAGVATVDTVLSITIGGGGAPGAGGSNVSTMGGTGGTSSIIVQTGSVLGNDGATYSPGTTFCACTGGAGGNPGTSSNTPAATATGGVASNGDQNDNGDPGGLPFGTSSTFWVSGSGGASPGNSASLFAQGVTQVTSTSPGVGGAGGGGVAAGTKGSDGGILIYR